MRGLNMKLKLLLTAAFLMLAGTAAAKVTLIADWSGNLPNRGEDRAPQTTCAAQCSGYSLTITICPDGKRIEECPATGCAYYHRCVNN